MVKSSSNPVYDSTLNTKTVFRTVFVFSVSIRGKRVGETVVSPRGRAVSEASVENRGFSKPKRLIMSVGWIRYTNQ